MKPIASGAEETPEGLRNEDALRIQAACSEATPYARINPFAFAPPIAPHIAAEQRGIELDFQQIHDHYQQLQARNDLVIVEGVGGLLVPLDEQRNIADLIQYLGLPAVMVAGLKLGGLNHALLTAEALEQRRLPVAGWVANQVETDMLEVENNLASLKARIRFPFLGYIPVFQKNPSAEAISKLITSFIP
jgi:dethiobiotin synthetase